MEREKFKCPKCGTEITVNLKEFVDVTENPEYKTQIMNGQFFLVRCPNCGDETLAEYPVMYMDPSKKLNVYMVPDHGEELLQQLNSLDIPDAEVDEEAVFRVVRSADQLLEKILIADGGRDDRLIELYKAVIIENIREEWPEVKQKDLLYFLGREEEYFIAWGIENAKGEQMTINLENELYEILKKDYLSALAVPAGKYAEVDEEWLKGKVKIEM